MSFSMARIVPISIVSYGSASFFMYKYGQMDIANKEIKDVNNKRKYLFEKHQEIAEGYDKFIEKRESVNKLIRFRKTLLSYADGDVLETG
jgi:hypothetical protein